MTSLPDLALLLLKALPPDEARRAGIAARPFDPRD